MFCFNYLLKSSFFIFLKASYIGIGTPLFSHYLQEYRSLGQEFDLNLCGENQGVKELIIHCAQSNPLSLQIIHLNITKKTKLDRTPDFEKRPESAKELETKDYIDITDDSLDVDYFGYQGTATTHLPYTKTISIDLIRYRINKIITYTNINAEAIEFEIIDLTIPNASPTRTLLCGERNIASQQSFIGYDVCGIHGNFCRGNVFLCSLGFKIKYLVE